MSLAGKTASGFFWTLSNQFSIQVINFIVLIILSRVLTPESFGLVAMLQIFLGIGISLLDSGMTSSLIRTPDADQKDYSSVFFINLFISCLIYVIVFFCAPLIASFYQQPILTSLVRVLTLVFIIQALVGVQTTRLTKEMNFRLQLYMQLPATIIGSATGVVLAYAGYGVWSLVYMNLVRAFFFMIQHWLRTDWRPSFVLDWTRLKHHFSFGYKLTLIGILNSLYTNMYSIIIGKFFSPLQVGFYNQANTFSLLPVDMISTSLDKVTYPAFAKIQSDNQRLKIVYKKVMQQVVYWTVPLMMLLIIVAEPLIRSVLTEKWLPAVPYFQILCIYGMMHPLQLYNINILKIKGRSDLMLKLEIIKKITGIAGVIGVIFWGIYPLLWFKVGYGVFLFYMNTRFSGKMIGYGMKEQLKDIYPFFLIGLLVSLLCWSFDYFLLSEVYVYDWLRIIIDSFLFFSIYLVIGRLRKIAALSDFTEIVLKNKRISDLLAKYNRG